ncbi:unnamed protein product, partial [Rotaria sp. Silwood1]
SSYQFNIILDRFSLEILPKINDKIERLSIESSFIKRILLVTNYPNLHALDLYDFEPETASTLFRLISLDQLINVPLNEDIKYSFRNFKNNQIISSVDYFSRTELLYCHVYSYPYTWTFYHNIANNFPGGLFKSVREISLYDDHPFEHDFF